MNEVGGSESGTGLRAIKSSRSSDANFEYDDSEWDVGIGNLIIDLDADIEKNNEANRINNNSDISSLAVTSGTGSLSTVGSSSSGTPSTTSNSSSGSNASANSSTSSSASAVTGSSNPQMHIPLTSSSGSNSNNSGSGNSKKSSGGNGSNSSSLSKGSSNNSSSSSDLSSVMEHSAVVDKGLKMKIKRTKTGTKSGADAKHEIVKNDVVGSSNGTAGGASSASNSGYSSNKSISDSISSKNSHSSHKDKDKQLLIKDGLLHDNSHESSGNISNATSGNSKQDNSTDHGGKVKTPRKGATKEKKVKNSTSNVGNSGNSKKDDKSNDSSKSLSNSTGGNSSSGSSGTHAKDNKEFFSTTVNLNVPSVIPNSSSSAFVKTSAIKVPTAPSSSSASSLLSSSSGGDSSSSGNSRIIQNLSTTNSSLSNSSSTPWGSMSPSKGAEKGRLSPSVSNLSNASEKNSYNKKSRTFSASEKVGSTPEDTSASHTGPSSGSSYRNQGALSINSATDLSTSSSSFVQNVPGTQTGTGFGSPKESGKCSRNTTPTTQDVCVGTSVGTVTEPDCLGPCEPGTSVTLEGIVWHETESGVLVVNVTWRGKTYVGTLIDCTKNDWAPPRFCDSPTSDLEMRTPKNRGKRGRAQTATPVNEPVATDTRSANAKLRNGAKGRRGSNTATAFVAPASPVKPDTWPKRKTRGSENESQEDVNPKSVKRPKVSKDGDRKDRRSNSPAPDNEKSGPSSPQLIECPEPNCFKRYKHINGLRYHQSHAHSNNFVAAEDSDSNMSTASNTNASATAEPSTNSADSTVEPMAVDSCPEVSDNGPAVSTATSSSADESLSAPSTPGKKSSSSSATPKVDDKIYDLSSDADLNPSKDTNSQTPEVTDLYNKSAKNSMASKPPSQAKDNGASANEQDSKLTPENLSKDSVTPPLSTASSSTPTTSTTTPTLTPRTPILTVPVVPYMSLQSRNLVHAHVVNVPRVETSLSSRENSENSPLKNSANQGSVPASKAAPWQPHAHSQSQSGLSGHGSHVMNTSPQSQSITVPLNIPMSIPGKDKDKTASPDQAPSKKNKHKKKSKDKDKERDGKSKGGDKEKQEISSNKSLSVPMGPSDYSRSSGLFHSSGLGSDSLSGRSKDTSGEDSESSRKNSLENREDPQSPAYSDISDANDSGPENELNVGSAIKDTPCKGLVIPGEIKKDTLSVPGVAGPPFQSFFNHSLHSPYLDSLNYARQNKEGPTGTDDPEKNRPSGPIKLPNLPPNSQANPAVVNPVDDGRRSPKMDFHAKYPYSNFYSYPYSSYQYPGPDHHPFGNPLAAENSFNSPVQNRMYGLEERDKESGGPGGLSGKNVKPADKEDGPGNVQIKQEPVERDERRVKDRPQSSALPMNAGEEKNVEIKSEYGSEHSEPKLMPPYMTNSSSKHHHSSKDHKRSDDRHDRRHDSKDMEKSESIKSNRNSSSSSDKNKPTPEETEAKERKDEGAKPTMETTGPPPPPTASSAYYLPQSYLGNPFGFPLDPSHQLYRPVLVPGPYPGSPYMHPGQIPRFPSPGGPNPLPEDLSRPSGGVPPGNPSKALDLLQHHAAQYYNSHKIHELHERALKSPSPQVSASQRGERDLPPSSGSGGPPTPSSPGGHSLPGGVGHPVGGRSSVGGTSTSGSIPKAADLSKDSKPIIGPGGSLMPGVPNSDNVRTPPPTQHHVHSHTHHHTHVGIGYPILPTVPPQYSPHYGVLATPPSAPSVIPPFPSQKPS